jgi:hypothetical protein
MPPSPDLPLHASCPSDKEKNQLTHPAPSMVACMLPTGGTIMDDEPTQHVEQVPMTEDAIQSRINELIAELTPAEKAGQLTQYFYFGSVPETDAEQIARSRRSWSRQPSSGARRDRCSLSLTPI